MFYLRLCSLYLLVASRVALAAPTPQNTDDGSQSWADKLNRVVYQGGLNMTGFLPCEPLSECMQDNSPLLAIATRYYGFRGCSSDQKRTLIKVEADAVAAVKIANGKKRNWAQDPELLEFFGPVQATRRPSKCRPALKCESVESTVAIVIVICSDLLLRHHGQFDNVFYR